ncbi:MAG TPA: phosphotransferase family protein [Thermoanaerobaculia bacterium]|nr:phosphotransferase family protein [Thermoanaerobaculia bacterium]
MSPQGGDEAGPIRPGEELPLERLDAWLQARIPGLGGPPEVSQYAGGASNWTYRLRYPGADLVLRRPPAGTKARSAHDVVREHRLQGALRPVFPQVPEMVACCEDESVIGAPFYVMRHLEGLVLRRSLPPGLELSPGIARRLCLNAIELLAALHRVDFRAAGLESLAPGAGYIRRQIEGWAERYRKARTWNVPAGEKILAWLRERMPSSERICLIHNDFRLDNLVLDRADPSRILAVLDWELATLGDPFMDLGNALAYWVEAEDDFLARSTRRQPTHLPGMLRRREVVEHYCRASGLELENWPFYEVYGLFRLSVIAQQIYYRYHHRETRNPAFRRFWIYVHYLHWRCRREMRRSG